tara:strand:- start:281 stop:451 length:171 start_codon:yes stop_codon:yes gene_type:complete
MYERERERERERVVFFGVSLLLHRKEKEKCQLFSVKREKKDKKRKNDTRKEILKNL